MSENGKGISYGLTGTELMLRSDLRKAALDAYSVVWEPSHKLTRDHQAAMCAAVAAALLHLAKAQHAVDCSCGSNMPEGTRCPSCVAGPDEVSQWLRRTGLQLDPEVETRDEDEG